MKEFKEIFQLEFPYWINKQLGLYLYWRNNDGKKALQLSIWEYHKIKELPEYKDDWFSSWWKNITIWRNYKNIKSK